MDMTDAFFCFHPCCPTGACNAVLGFFVLGGGRNTAGRSWPRSPTPRTGVSASAVTASFGVRLDHPIFLRCDDHSFLSWVACLVSAVPARMGGARIVTANPKVCFDVCWGEFYLRQAPPELEAGARRAEPGMQF